MNASQLSAVRQITPMVPVSDVRAAAAFLENTLGFEARIARPEHAYLTHGTGALRLIPAPPGADMHDERRQIAVYVDIDAPREVDALYADHAARIEAMPPTHWRAPFDTGYGTREFHIIYEALQLSFGALHEVATQ